MLDPFSHLLLVFNSSMNILFYGLFNKKFRDVAKKEFDRCFPKAATRSAPSESKRLISLSKPKFTNNRTNTDFLPATDLTQTSNNRQQNEQSIPLTSILPVDVSNSKEKPNSHKDDSGPQTIKISVSNSNKLLTDSSTQIPNSEYTTNLKGISMIERSNIKNKNDTIEDPLKGNAIQVTSSISKKTFVNEECMNIESHSNNTDLDKITKHPTPFKIIESEDLSNNTRTKKVCCLMKYVSNI